MLKRKILTALIVAVFAIPSLFVTALAVEPYMVRNINNIAPAASFSGCITCYVNTSEKIRNHTNGKFSCKLDKALNGTYFCKNTNYASTSLIGSTYTQGYKDAYVYERDSSGTTKTDYKYSNGRTYPSSAASVDPINNYIPVCVRHEVTVPHPVTAESLMHIRNYE